MTSLDEDALFARLKSIPNLQQRNALRLAIEQGVGIPDYAWTPRPEDFDMQSILDFPKARELVDVLKVNGMTFTDIFP